MPTTPIARRRLAAQRLVRPASGSVRDLVRTLGAVQAQDYGGAKWGLAQRLADEPTDAVVEAAHDAGEIVRTHLLRPTWHFVAAEDLRWILALTAPRVRASMAGRWRQLGIDAPFVRRANDAIARALEGGRHLTRAELAEAMAHAGVDASAGERATHLMLAVELDAVVCSGPRRGRQFTYALLDERVPATGASGPADPAVELARRYFTTRGPATLNDWAWWSGLTVGEGRRAVAALGDQLVREEIDGVAYWSAADAPSVRARGPVARLLPAYDELFIGFRDRGALLQRAPAVRERWAPAAMTNVVAIDGQLVGFWSRTTRGRSTTVALDPLVPLDAGERRALAAEVTRYGAFVGVPATMR